MTADLDKPPVQVQLPAWFDYVLPATIAVLAVAIMIGGLFPMLSLRYERNSILSGEIWRILTGHLVHLTWNHLLLNLGGLALIWLLFGKRLMLAQWLIVLLSCAIAISAGLMVFHPHLNWYVGLSGLLHGMFVAGALGGLFSGYRAEWLLLGLLVLKLAWEQLSGALPGTGELAGGFVVVDAHLYGALTGLAVALLLRALYPHPGWRSPP
jgi:rhomboid family GlyGly-CTERM serine protease